MGATSRVLFDSVVKNVVNTKKRKQPDNDSNTSTIPTFELEVPDNARLTYHVYIRDRADGFELSPPAVYRHTDSIIANGAFTYLKESFEAHGHSPAFEILTPYGIRSVSSESDWDQAVIAIYNRRRSGGQVEVDVFL